jgi:hypothetical protein
MASSSYGALKKTQGVTGLGAVASGGASTVNVSREDPEDREKL